MSAGTKQSSGQRVASSEHACATGVRPVFSTLLLCVCVAICGGLVMGAGTLVELFITALTLALMWGIVWLDRRGAVLQEQFRTLDREWELMGEIMRRQLAVPPMKQALAAVRAGNAAVESMLRRGDLLVPSERAGELSRLKVELSVAAGLIAKAIDDAEPETDLRHREHGARPTEGTEKGGAS